MSKDASGKIFTITIFILAGIFIFSKGVKPFKLSIDSEVWPSTQGIITSSEVISKTSGSGTKRKTYYHADVNYDYVIENRSFKSNVVSFAGYGARTSNHANSIISKYPVGSEVKVYYDGSSPDISVLEPGLHKGVFLYLGGGLILIIIGVMGLLNKDNYR